MARLGRIIAWPAGVLVLFLTAGGPHVRSQPGKELLGPPRLPGESLRTLQRFADAGKLAADGQHAEAVDEYLRILDEAGDDLLPTDPKQPRHLVQVRRLCHIRLAALPPAALKIYRARVDEPARRRFEQAAAARDEPALRRIVAETFCSRHTDRALDLLGDLAFERGDFDEAERSWRMLLPGAATDLVFPDPQVDPALVRAKLLLAKWYRGERRSAADDLASFRKLHGEAEGTLAGRKGKFGDILQSLLKQADLPAAAGEDDWPTFAGGADRNKSLPATPRLRWVDQPWRVPLDGAGPALLPGKAAQAFLPAVVGDRVVVADVRGVTVFELNSGRRLGRWDLAEAVKVNLPLVPALPEARFTVTAAGNRLFVRLGATGLGFPKRDQPAGDSYLVCLDLPADGKPALRWHVAGRSPELKDALYWEGAPVVHAGRAYIAWTQFAKAPGMTGIDCYDADTGARLWRQEVCEAQDGGEPRYRHHLLTLAGPYLVYCAHAGAVVALDPATGKRVWAVRYPRRGHATAEGNQPVRDLAPCVFAAGRLYVAPADTDRVLCLDAAGGRLLWESKPLEVFHLLGVARGKVIVTTGAVPRGIRALDAETGQDIRTWLQPDDGATELPSQGRGLLAGDLVFWPTRDGLRILGQEDGQPSADAWVPHGKVPGGNLAAGHGCLIVATDRELLGFVPPARLLGPRKAQAADRPNDPQGRLRLAQAQADAGSYAAAIQTMHEAAELAGKTELAKEIFRQEHELLREMARAEKDLPPPSLVQAAESPRFPVELRLQARAELAEVWAQTGKRDRAVETWQSILDQAELRTGTFIDAGVPHLAANLAAARIAALAGKPAPEPSDLPAKLDAPGAEPPPRLELAWESRWQGSRRLLSADAEALVFQSSDLVCLSAATGKESWRAALGETMVWACRDGDRVVAGGPRLVACLGLADGKVRWRLSAPPEEDFSAYQQVGRRLFLLLGGRRFIAYDIETCRVLWHRWAPGGQVRPPQPAGCFFPDYFVDSKLLAIQTGSGKLWLVKPESGKHQEAATTRAPWPQPPRRLAPDLLLVAPDRQHLAGYWLPSDPAVEGGYRWNWKLERPASLTGEPPQVLLRGRTLIVFVPRNYGGDLERWDPEAGQPKWRKTLFLGQQTVNLSLAALDERNLYLITGREAQAFQLSNGERLWQAQIPGPGDTYRLVATIPGGLFACPVEAKLDLNRERVLSWLLATEPTLLVPTWQPMTPAGVVAGIRLTAMEMNAPSRCAVSRLDPANGKVLQKVDLASRGKEVGVWLGQGRLHVVMADAAWSFE